MRFRDFIEIRDHFFSVLKGCDPVICILRYAPSNRGMKKVQHSHVHTYFKEYYRDGLHYIPLKYVERHYDAMKMLEEVCERDMSVRNVANFFKLDKMGVTGSRLIGLEREDSDVDFVLYGECFEIGREKVRRGLERGVLDRPDFEKIYEKRKTSIPYSVFKVHEERKYNRAILDGIDFDILYVGEDVKIMKGEKVGKVIVRGKVIEARPFDYPAYYKLPGYDVLCYTHTFVGQAFEGEVVEVRGNLEIHGGKKFIIVGSRREVEDEYVVSLTLLEKRSIIDEFKMWR